MTEADGDPLPPPDLSNPANQGIIRAVNQAWLGQVAETLRAKKGPEQISVRNLLGMFGYMRRGRSIALEIRDELRRYGLGTMPDFESTGFDSSIEFVLLKPEGNSGRKGFEPATTNGGELLVQGNVAVVSNTAGDTDRIGSLQSGSPLVWVKPEEDITVAETRMLLNDYSQLPVLRGRNDLRGVVTWRSIGQARRNGKSTGAVTRFMNSDCRVVDATSPLFRALGDLLEYEFVLIRDQFRSISGIVTTTDLAKAFGEQFEPFALLGEIEFHLRRIIGAHFTLDDWRAAADPSDRDRPVTSVGDLTFGEYLRLVEQPENWQKLGLTLGRTDILHALNEVREIRNDVMHFSPDPIEHEAVQRLRTFAAFVRPLL